MFLTFSHNKCKFFNVPIQCVLIKKSISKLVQLGIYHAWIIYYTKSYSNLKLEHLKGSLLLI